METIFKEKTTSYGPFGIFAAPSPCHSTFNGTDDGLTLTNKISLTESTFIFDIMFNSFPGSSAIIMCNASTTKGYIRLESSKKIRIAPASGGSWGTNYIYSLGIKYQIAVVVQADKVHKYYVDGAFQQETGALLYNDYDILNIGSIIGISPLSANYYGIRVYNYAFSNEQITAYYGGTIPTDYVLSIEPKGQGDYEYDMSGNNNHATWSGTGARKMYSINGSFDFKTRGFSLWRKSGESDIQVPYDKNNTALVLVSGASIPVGYEKYADILGDADYWNLADTCFDFNPSGITESKLDIFDKSNSTIHIATGGMDYYDANHPYMWRIDELTNFTKCNSYFNEAYQDRLFAKVEDNKLKEILNCTAKQTGSALTKAKSYCGIT